MYKCRYECRYSNLTKQALNCLEAKHRDRIRELYSELRKCKESLELIQLAKNL